jgi:hypothetical protein
MKIIKIVMYTAVLSLLSCKPTSVTTTQKVNESEIVTKQGIFYALPKTNISFMVEAVRTDIVPGPYHNYAEKYIGISNVPHSQSSQWKITNININSFNDIDASAYYVLNPTGKFNVNIDKLIKNEIVFPINSIVKNEYENQFYGRSNNAQGVVFKDLSVTKYIGEEKVTYFKRVQKDSVFAKVPVVKTQSVYKTFENKAEEAASFIFMIREKRFELLSGMADYYPDGKALEVALAELNRLENEYLDLFIGKTYQSTYSANFEFSPTIEQLNQPNILFRFSEDKGILPANDLSGRPIIIELEKLNDNKDLSQINLNNPNEHDNLYYRLPELTKVSIFDSNSLLANRKIKIYQFGNTILLPTMYLMDDEKFIEFYYEED